MLKNYLKIAWRNLAKNKMHSFINIIGLTIGLYASMLVITVVIDDLSYDIQWNKADRLYRVLTKFDGGGENDKFPQAMTALNPAMKENFPEIEAVSSVYISDLELKKEKISSETIKVTSIETDPEIWKLFDFNILFGTPKEFKEGKDNLVISESFQKKYFPGENPVGKIIYHLPPYRNEPIEYEITGVIKDIPSNTHLRADVILIKPSRIESFDQNWHTFSFYYTILKPGTDVNKLTTKVDKWYAGLVKEEKPSTFEFQPIKDVYLHSQFADYQPVKGDYSTIFILSGIALLLLIIACINFINLTTARTVYRMREIGVRKILGAGKRNVVFQFLTESLLFFMISTVFGVLFYFGSLPYIERFLGNNLTITFVTVKYLFVIVFLIIVAISLLIGLYPAFVISGFKPISALKGTLGSGNKSSGNFVLKSLVTVQFSISIAVLIGLIIVQQQVNFINTRDIGYDKDNLIAIDFVSWNGKGESFKVELLKLPFVKNVSITDWIPSRGAGSMGLNIKDPINENKQIAINVIQGDADLPTTLKLHLKKGRLFDNSFQSDKMSWEGYSLNAKEKDSAKALRSSLVTAYTAKILQVNDLDIELKGTQTSPVGLIDNFHNESLKNKLKPTIIFATAPSKYSGMLIRVNPKNERETLSAIHNVWKQFFPNRVLGINWVNDLLEQQYSKEAKFRKLFVFFSLISMFLALLGIFGLIEHAVARRIKEVGIRKVLGASISSIIILFSKSFLKLVVLAVLIATPFAWYGASTWLQEFAYKIDIKWWVFAIAGIITITIVLLTLIFQTTKAAIVNPVKSLRSE
ncbi:ABC transporter permease [Aureibaculum luteum]|uniref:ABC transporter permease n=1 Tax=Aureibaculum luteum TaxID=1548456 RepID=UPI000E5381F8|nr:FtsX-like permease family protein [Aureibaculum luteum]